MHHCFLPHTASTIPNRRRLDFFIMQKPNSLWHWPFPLGRKPAGTQGVLQFPLVEQKAWADQFRKRTDLICSEFWRYHSVAGPHHCFGPEAHIMAPTHSEANCSLQRQKEQGQCFAVFSTGFPWCPKTSLEAPFLKLFVTFWESQPGSQALDTGVFANRTSQLETTAQGPPAVLCFGPVWAYRAVAVGDHCLSLLCLFFCLVYPCHVSEQPRSSWRLNFPERCSNSQNEGGSKFTPSQSVMSSLLSKALSPLQQLQLKVTLFSPSPLLSCHLLK